MTYIIDDGQRNCPKHVEFHFQNEFEKLVHLVGFIIGKFVTMDGHMNVKKRKEFWLIYRSAVIIIDMFSTIHIKIFL
jgi:hypothetical protein